MKLNKHISVAILFGNSRGRLLKRIDCVSVGIATFYCYWRLFCLNGKPQKFMLSYYWKTLSQ